MKSLALARPCSTITSSSSTPDPARSCLLPVGSHSTQVYCVSWIFLHNVSFLLLVSSRCHLCPPGQNWPSPLHPSSSPLCAHGVQYFSVGRCGAHIGLRHLTEIPTGWDCGLAISVPASLLAPVALAHGRHSVNKAGHPPWNPHSPSL